MFQEPLTSEQWTEAMWSQIAHFIPRFLGSFDNEFTIRIPFPKDVGQTVCLEVMESLAARGRDESGDPPLIHTQVIFPAPPGEKDHPNSFYGSLIFNQVIPTRTVSMDSYFDSNDF